MDNAGAPAQIPLWEEEDMEMPSRKHKTADRLLGLAGASEPMRRAKAAENRGRHSEAGAAFEDAGMPVDALRNWRLAADFEKALELAKGTAQEDLKWLVLTEAIMRRRPDGIQDRLTAAERRRLSKAMRLPLPS